MKKNNFKKLILFILIFSLIVPTSGCGKSGDTLVSLTDFCFNTVITITIYEYPESKKAKNIIQECFQICSQYEQLFSKTIENSDISRINQSYGNSCTVAPVVSDIISDSIEYSKLSDGAFDISVGVLTDLWNITGDNPTVPSENSIKQALTHVNYRQINCQNDTVTLSDAKMQLDLGSIVKGFVADKLKEYLVSEGVSSAIIDLGGNILTIGKKSQAQDFIIGIKNPFFNNSDIIPETSASTYRTIADNEEYCAKINISGQSVVTSGIYERYFMKDNHLYHHIIDTSTGYPVDNELASVTIISNSSEDGDALSTTAFTLGLDKGMSLINNMENIEAVFITKTGELYMTNGLEASENGNIIIKIKSQNAK